MMKFIKSNLKVFVAIVLTTIIVGAGTVYAVTQYYAKDIIFESTNEGWNPSNVEDALNDLYKQANNYDFTKKSIYHDLYSGDRTANKDVSLTLDSGEYLIMLNFGISWGNSSIVNYSGKNPKELSLSSGSCISILSNENNRSASVKLNNLYYTEQFYTSIYSCKFEKTTTVKYIADTVTYNDSPIVLELNGIRIR